MSRGQAIPINYYLLLLIITYYCLLFPWAMYWSIMMGNDNTRRDKIDICNLPLLYTIAQTTKKRMNRREIKTPNTPQEHIAEKLQHWYIEPAKREIHWDKDNVLRIWERNAITLQLYKERSKHPNSSQPSQRFPQSYTPLSIYRTACGHRNTHV